jgi:hypothetical protein
VQQPADIGFPDRSPQPGERSCGRGPDSGISVGGLRMQQSENVRASELAHQFDSGRTNLLVIIG